MHITRVEIRNYRNFKHLDLRLGLNAVLIGPNRVGKSNFLHALRLVLDPTMPDSLRQLRPEDFWDGLQKPFYGAVISVAVEISGFADSVDAKALLQDSLVEKSPPTARITYQFRPKPTIAPSRTGDDDYTFIIFGGTNETRWVSHDLRRMISLILLPALRDVESELQSWRRSPLRPLLERLKLDKKKIEKILSDLNQATDTLLNEAPVKELSKQLTERLATMASAAQTTDPRLGFASARPEQVFRAVRLFIDGDKSRPITDASLGTANILFLVLLMQDLEERRRNKDTVETIIGIEEPEAHLHPHVQRLVFRYFLGHDAPIVGTTHSAHIASVTPLDSMVLLKSDISEGTKAYTTRALNLSEADKADLQRYLDVTRAEMLFARGVILVEGPAEQYLVPAFATAMGIELDRQGITVCSVAGIDFRPYYTLLSKQGFDIPCVIVTDGDPVDKNGIQASAGVRRGIRLLPEGPIRQKVENEISKGDWGSARKSLAKSGIFVGMSTLEVDCLATLEDVILSTYEDFVTSERRRESFAQLANAAKQGDGKAAEDLIRRIEEIGKGRFAQRMASRVTKQTGPSYITAAIKQIVAQVGL